MQRKFVYSRVIRFENKMCADMRICVVRNWKEECHTSNTIYAMLRTVTKLEKRHFKRKAMKLRDSLIINHPV
jgi:hypothetical protein